MMVYFDTNVWVYAFSQNVDNEAQQQLAIKQIEDAMENETIIVSEVLLCELAFVLAKVEEDNEAIDAYLAFVSSYIKPTDTTMQLRVLELLKETQLYKSSFDVHHVAFSEYYEAKLITFDKGFKHLKSHAKIALEIL